MTPSHRKFGELLEEGIKRVHIVQKKPMGVILDEFGYELRPDGTKGRYALGHWYYKKRIPADMADVEKLARMIVTNSDVDRNWLEQFLESAGHPDPIKLCNQYFLAPPPEQPFHETAPHETATASPQIAPEELPGIDEPPAYTGRKNKIKWAVLAGVGLIVLLAIVGLVTRKSLYPSTVSQRVTPTDTARATPTITPTPINTAINSPTPKASASPTLTVTLPQPSVTSPPSPSPTLVQAAAFDGICPKAGADDPYLYTGPESFVHYLNTGGSPARMELDFNTQAAKDSALRYAHVGHADLTGDGVEEVILDLPVAGGSEWQILGCHAGSYQPMLVEDYPQLVILQVARDVNADSKAEIVRYQETVQENIPSMKYSILRWNGNGLQELMDTQRLVAIGGRLTPDAGRWDSIVVSGTAILSDTHHDRILDLVVRGGLENDTLNCDTVYQREYSDTWVWNGKTFQLSERAFTPPVYRFQAAVDGDIAFLFKQYDRALLRYQQVAFDDLLHPRGWFTPQLEYCGRLGAATKMDPVQETLLLEAYARWRILLIHVVQGHMDAAETVYATLQARFPPGSTGSVYAAFAKAFWDAYQESQDVLDACSAAEQTVQGQPLYPGQTLETICPANNE